MKRSMVRSVLAIAMAGIGMIGGFNVTGKPVKAETPISNPRIIEDESVTWDLLEFGKYDQDVIFQPNKIKWRILNIDEDSVFLLADQDVGGRIYNTGSTATWETCSLRKWLNEDFYNVAFSETEKGLILPTDVVTEDNPLGENAVGGNDTEDYVYLLSTGEVSNSEYGFVSNESRILKGSDYARANDADRDTNKLNSLYDNSAKWWLRSPGHVNSNAALVYDSGSVSSDEFVYGIGYTCCVRPVINVKRSALSNATDAGEVDSKGNVSQGNDGFNNPRVNDNVTTWDCIYFGNYYQTATYDNKPILWRVLSVKGNNAFIMADKGLDCKLYNDINGKEYTDEDDASYTDYACTWDKSSLREWLNKDFYNAAFTNEEQNSIIQTTVSNKNTEDDTEGIATTDRIYLLSAEEAANKEYGFEYNSGIVSKVTDYAWINGAYRAKLYDGEQYIGNGYYWLRTPGMCVGYSAIGSIANLFDLEYETWGRAYGKDDYEALAVRPVMHIDMSSAKLSVVGRVSDDGTYVWIEKPSGGEDEDDPGVVTPPKDPASEDKPATGGSNQPKQGENANSSGNDPASGTVLSTEQADTAKPAATGTQLVSNTLKLKVTSSNESNPTVAYTGTTNKKAKSVTIPEKVQVDGITYAVTSIAEKAFSGNKNITKLTITKNITSIGSSAFSGCKNLKKVTIKSMSLKSIGKNAFKGINKKATIKVPKKKYKEYKKLFSKKTGYKKTMKIKK